jgi:hypothetical protein
LSWWSPIFLAQPPKNLSQLLAASHPRGPIPVLVRWQLRCFYGQGYPQLWSRDEFLAGRGRSIKVTAWNIGGGFFCIISSWIMDGIIKNFCKCLIQNTAPHSE